MYNYTRSEILVRKLLLIGSMIVAAVAGPACGVGPDGTTPGVDGTSVVTIAIAPDNAALTVGATQQFTATAKNAAGATVSAATFSWLSSNTAVVSVGSSGLATAVAGGSSNLSATSGGVTATVPVTVTSPVTTWVAKASMATARGALATAVVNGIIYAIGGENLDANALNPHLAAVEAYDPAANLWTTKAPLPAARSSLSAAAVGNVIFVFGGDDVIAPTANANVFNPLNKVEAYDVATNVWTTKAAMPTRRERFAIAELNGVIYVMGGIIPSGTFVDSTASVQAYTVATNTWATKASLPAARNDLSASVVGGVIYAMGGQGSSAAYAYNPSTDTWTTKASMALINGPLASVANASTVFAMNSNADIEAFSPLTNMWVTKAGTRTGYTSRGGSSLVVVGTTMYSIGGRDFLVGTYPTVEARGLP